MFRRLNHCAVPTYAPLSMDSNDPDTVQCSFLKRLLRDVPVAKPGILREFKEFVRRYLVANVRKSEPLDFEEWLEGTSYNTTRKEELRAVYDLERGAPPGRRARQKVDAFVKTEFYCEWKNARMINSRCDKFKVWSGPRFKAIENVVYEIPEFVKHVPCDERPSRVAGFKKAGRRYYATDFTAYESHFSPAFIRACEGQLYEHVLSNDVDARILTNTIAGVNRMKTRTGISAKCKGRRMSGDMCTSLGNGFANLMLAKFIAHKKGGEITGFVEGDDGLFATDVELCAQDWEDLGFTIKIDEISDPCTASFCGMIFADSGEVIRSPIKFLMGFGWTKSFINAGERIMDELLRAKALSTVYETPQCPIVSPMARYALQKTRHVTPRFIDDGYHQIIKDEFILPDFNPADDTRDLFARLFGVSVDTQLEIERLIGVGDMAGVARLLPAPVDSEEYASKYVVID